MHDGDGVMESGAWRFGTVVAYLCPFSSAKDGIFVSTHMCAWGKASIVRLYYKPIKILVREQVGTTETAILLTTQYDNDRLQTHAMCLR